MDRQRTKKPAIRGRRLVIGVILLLTAAATGLLFRMDFSTWRVERDQVRIGTVQFGDLDITVSGHGQLLPREIELVSSRVEGTVSRIRVKPGDPVEQGHKLVELRNPALQDALDIARYSLEGARAEILSSRAELENQLLNQRAALIQLRFALDKARLDLAAKRRLVDSGAISRIDFEQAELNVGQLEALVALEEEKLDKASASMDDRLEVLEARVRQAERGLARAHADIESLAISASLSGIVQDIRVDFGQRLRPGDLVGRLARQDSLFAELRVPSRQAADLARGQRVRLDTRNGLVNGRVNRIDPAVVSGNVVVDVDIDPPLPHGLRPEQQVEGSIYVAEIRDSLYVRKPAYSRRNSALNVYVLEPDDRYARRRTIEIGRTSVNHVEVLAGVREGEQIILSENHDWRDHDRILLN